MKIYACMTIGIFKTVIFQSNLSANEIDLLKLYMNVSSYILLHFFFNHTKSYKKNLITSSFV